MQGFIKTKDEKGNGRLINLKYIQKIEFNISMQDIVIVMQNFSCILFEPQNDFESSEEFLNRMIDRIFFILSDCEYDNVFIDIEVIKNDITKELKEERENDDWKIFTK